MPESRFEDLLKILVIEDLLVVLEDVMAQLPSQFEVYKMVKIGLRSILHSSYQHPKPEL